MSPPPRNSTFALALLAGPGLLVLGWIARLLPPGLRPFCVMHTVTGVPCPSCGSFRALRLFVLGRWGEAFLMQPLMTLVFTGVLLASLAAAALWLLRRPAPEPPRVSRGARAGLIVLLVLLVLLNWLYLVRAGI